MRGVGLRAWVRLTVAGRQVRPETAAHVDVVTIAERSVANLGSVLRRVGMVEAHGDVPVRGNSDRRLEVGSLCGQHAAAPRRIAPGGATVLTLGNNDVVVTLDRSLARVRPRRDEVTRVGRIERDGREVLAADVE